MSWNPFKKKKKENEEINFGEKQSSNKKNSFSKKKFARGDDLFSDSFNPFKNFKEFSISFDFNKMEKMMNELMDSMMSQQSDFPLGNQGKNKPLVMGFSMNIGQDGKPRFQEFGNVKPMQGKTIVANSREPLVDVQSFEKDYQITAELPGVKKQDIDLKVLGNKLVLKVNDKENPFFKEILLNKPVKENSIKAEFNNGILEVSIAKQKQEKQGKPVKIE